MGVYLEKLEDTKELAPTVKKLAGASDFEAYRFCDDFEGEPKLYTVFKIVTDNGVFVLKKGEDEEYHEAEKKHYALLSGLPAPEYLGESDGYILTRFVSGDDLKTATDDGILAAAKSLAEIMNAYPMGRDYDGERYQRYLRRLEKRAGCLGEEPELARAFKLFFERQKEIPLTLSNSDLLPINVLYDGKRATIIDWEFGGFMPYDLDIVRFVAHGCTNGATPFYMTDEQKRLFTDTVYALLTVKPDRERYESDLVLAEFNEYIEILEYYLGDKTVPREGTFEHYYPRALALARVLLQ